MLMQPYVPAWKAFAIFILCFLEDFCLDLTQFIFTLFISGFYIPFTYIPDFAEDCGMTSQQSALIISIIGILNTVARVMVGWIADRPWADALILNSVALVVGGVSTMFVPYFVNFGLMATYAVVFGVAIGKF